MSLNQVDLCGCKPTQIVNLNMAFNNLNNLEIYDECDNKYDLNNLQFSYSVDGLCWSCYLSYNDLLTNTVELTSDLYIRFKVQGGIKKIIIDNSQFTDYSTQLDTNFNFTSLAILSL